MNEKFLNEVNNIIPFTSDEETRPTLYGQVESSWEELMEFDDPYDAIPYLVLTSKFGSVLLVMYGFADKIDVPETPEQLLSWESERQRLRCRVLLFMKDGTPQVAVQMEGEHAPSMSEADESSLMLAAINDVIGDIG